MSDEEFQKLEKVIQNSKIANCKCEDCKMQIAKLENWKSKCGFRKVEIATCDGEKCEVTLSNVRFVALSENN
jgi:hypothetical protein